MPIEFPCNSCGQTLRVPDNAVGKKAKCPKCETINVVPAAETSTAELPPAQPIPPVQPIPPAQPNITAQPSEFSADTENPFQSPGYEEKTSTGGEIGPLTELSHGRVDFGSVITNSFNRVKENIGICIAAGFILIGLFIVTMVVNNVLMSLFIPVGNPFGGFGRFGGGGVRFNMIDLVAFQKSAALAQLIGGLIMVVPNAWVTCGAIRFSLKICRREEANVGEMLSGSPHFISMLGIFLLYYGIGAVFQLPQLLGMPIFMTTVISLVGSIIIVMVGLFIFSAPYFIIERAMKFSEAIKLSIDFMQGNKLSAFGVILVAAIIVVAAIIFSCLLATPIALMFISIVYSMIYLQATGQIKQTQQ